MFEVELPYPPSVNHYYRRIGSRTIISREGRRYRQKVIAALAGLGLKTLEGPLEVYIALFPPDRRRRDIDNTQKALLDSLQHGGAYRDDSQIKKLVAEMHDDIVPGGRVVVAIRKRHGHGTPTQ